MTALPTPAGNDQWGTTLNTFLGVSLNTDGTVKSPVTFASTVVGRGASVISFKENTFAATIDPTLYVGYNQDANGNVITASEPGLSWAIEGDYNDGSGANKMEAYLQFKSANNGGFLRPIFAQFNRSTEAVSALQFSAPLTQIFSSDTTTVSGVNAVNSATVNVADASTFPSSGSLSINQVTVTYTGKTASSFTGCGSHAAYVGAEKVTNNSNIADFAKCVLTLYANDATTDNIIRMKAPTSKSAQLRLGYNAVDDVGKIYTASATQLTIDVESATACVRIFSKPNAGTAGGSICIGGVSDNSAVGVFDNKNNSASVKGIVIRQRASSQTGAMLEIQDSTTAVLFAIASNGRDFTLDTTTGTKIGTATTQKLAFYNSTPVVQPATTGETVGFTAGGGTTATDASTFTGNVGSTAYRISDIVKHLKNLGLIAA